MCSVVIQRNIKTRTEPSILRNTICIISAAASDTPEESEREGGALLDIPTLSYWSETKQRSHFCLNWRQRPCLKGTSVAIHRFYCSKTQLTAAWEKIQNMKNKIIWSRNNWKCKSMITRWQWWKKYSNLLFKKK